MAFIGFKVSVMGLFGLLWLIITFMHDLRWQCRTRRTQLKFNHFLIYVFMQPVDDHERNIMMRLISVWYASRVQLLCRKDGWPDALFIALHAESQIGHLWFSPVLKGINHKLQIFCLCFIVAYTWVTCFQSEASPWSTHSFCKQWGADMYHSCQYSSFFFPGLPIFLFHYSLSDPQNKAPRHSDIPTAFLNSIWSTAQLLW